MGGRPSGGSRRWWIAYSALGLAAIAAFFAFPLSTGVRSAIEVAFPLSNVVAIVVGVRMFRPERTGPWMLFAVGMAFFTAYTLARAVARIGVGPSDPQTLLEQIFQAIGYVLVIAALVSLIYSRRGGESDRTTLIDASILVIGAAIPFWVFVLAPLAHNASFSLGARLSPMSSAVADLVLLAVSVRLALSRGARTTAFSLLIAAMVSSLVANTMVVPALSGGSALTQTSPFNIFFLAAYLFAGAAPLHPSMKALTDVGHHESRLTAARIVMFSLASLTGWMSYLVQVVRALPVDFTVVLMGTVVIFFLVLLRLVGIADALERREQSARLLFESSPLPMWVYDANDMRFLAVNDAAVHHYGYQRDEFLTMTLREIRPEEDVRALEEHMETVNPWTMNHGLWRHRKRDGSVIDVEVASHGVTFD
ncbi:MAG TPA: PAS domain S-box protein, partial [Actinomycetota bacterium]|nr:PAS domain S-box protein [Actinomycetota bacterium]